MDLIVKQYETLLRHTEVKVVRDIYNKIDWRHRLIGIKGERGVGKTTLLLQRIKLSFENPGEALYATLDDMWFATHSLMDFAMKASEAGVTHLFLDEVHRLPNWERQLKNVYDLCPTLSIVFTGSSLLEIDNSIADLSRRCIMYTMPILSFREYLGFEGIDRGAFPLSDILYRHETIAPQICAGINIKSMFRKYLRNGCYPFYKSMSEVSYLQSVNNTVRTVVDYDIPAIENVEYATLLKIKHLLVVMAAQTPSPLNADALSRSMGVSKNLVMKMLALLGRAKILTLLYYKTERVPNSLAKPQKVLIGNPSIAYALGKADKGKVRESFLASMLSYEHETGYPTKGDIAVDGRYVIEIGGDGKGYSQIKDLPDSFIAADDIESGFGNKIPLWLFGFLY